MIYKNVIDDNIINSHKNIFMNPWKFFWIKLIKLILFWRVKFGNLFYTYIHFEFVYLRFHIILPQIYLWIYILVNRDWWLHAVKYRQAIVIYYSTDILKYIVDATTTRWCAWMMIHVCLCLNIMHVYMWNR